MDDTSLKKELFERYGVAMSEDDPAWLIFKIHKDLTDDILQAIDKTLKTSQEITSNGSTFSQTQKEIIESLTEEQMKLQQLSSVIDKMSSATAKTAQDMLDMFQSNLQTKIDQAFDRVDDTVVQQSLQQTIEKSLKSINTEAIDNAAKSMNAGASKIDKLDQVMSDRLRHIAIAVKDFNDVIQNIKFKSIIAIGGVALLFGITIGWIIKAEIVNSDYINWNVPSDHRQFDDVKNANFIRFTKEEAENRGDGYFYVKIKQLPK